MNETVMIPDSSKILLRFLEEMNQSVDDRGSYMQIAFNFYMILNVICAYYFFNYAVGVPLANLVFAQSLSVLIAYQIKIHYQYRNKFVYVQNIENVIERYEIHLQSFYQIKNVNRRVI